MKDNFIRFSNYYKFYTSSRPFWFQHNEEDNLSKEFFSISDPDEDEGDIDNAHLVSIEQVFNKYEQDLLNFTESFFKNKRIYFIKSVKTEDKIIETKSIYESNEWDVIINGIYENNDVIVDLLALDVKQNIIYVSSFKDTPLIKDFVKTHYAFNIIKNWFLKYGKKINDINIVCRKEVDLFELNTFYFKVVPYCLPKKTKPNRSSNIYKMLNKKNIINLDFFKHFKEAKLLSQFETQHYCEVVLSNTKNASDNKGSNVDDASLFKINEKKFDLNFNYAINELKKEMKNPTFLQEYLEKHKNDYILLYEENQNKYGKNPEVQSIFEYLLGKEKANLQGTKFSKLKLLNELENPENGYSTNNMAEMFISDQREFILNDIELLMNEIRQIDNKKIVWYDYESISLPFAIIENIRPYQQIVFQMSIITTDNNKITNTKDIVYDPKNINVFDFVSLFISLYDSQAEKYVVYNKSFENKRNQEMIDYINYIDRTDQTFSTKIQQKFNINVEKLNEIQKEINEKTFDLADFFNINKHKILFNNSTIPLVYLKELKFKHSIKKIEKYVTSRNLELAHNIKQYSSLNIQNGLLAQEAGINRYIGVHKNNDWKNIENDLKVYCHNDVMAMLMVFDLIKHLLNKHQNNTNIH